MGNLGYVMIRQNTLGQNNLKKLHDLEIRTHDLIHIARLSIPLHHLRSRNMMLLQCISTWCHYTVSTRYLCCMSPLGCQCLCRSFSVCLSHRPWMWLGCRAGQATGTSHWHWNSRLALPGFLPVPCLLPTSAHALYPSRYSNSDSDHSLAISRHSQAFCRSLY